ncbi:MAG: LysR substrate-binding domain-containing protein [Pseudomonadota bacterium]
MDNIPELSVRHLRAIVALGRFESFVAAATYLRISQSGLTRLIQQAEKLIGVQLFHRGSRRVMQTDAGEVIVQASERMLSDLALQVQSARVLDGELRGQITISSLMSISHRVLPRALMSFRSEHSSIHVHVREGLGDDVYDDIRRGQVDFGIANVEGVTEDMTVAAAAEEACYLVVPLNHPLAALKHVRLHTLADEQLISMPPESGLRKAIDMAAHSQGIALHHSVIINQFGSMFDFVRNGLGVAIVPAVALPPNEQEGIVVKPLRPKISRRIGILHLKDRPLSSVASTFLDIFRPIFLGAIH